ncbi:MAG: hypothetical protein C0474_00990 [Sphingobium sp.]|nr:hypothetical protein [Sphingobium sp.]
MGLTFNSVLQELAVDPRDVRLLRHQTGPYYGRTPYTLWRDDRSGFLTYQSIQSVQNRPRLAARYWASFVVTPAQSTLFTGLYQVERVGPCDPQIIDPLRLVPVTQGGARELDLYTQALVDASAPLAGRVFIDWGAGTRSWVQRADNQAKPIVEVARAFQEEAFPGYARFIGNLSAIETLPSGWLSALRAARGIYLLTCPRTREQYVGSATGEAGFLGRWLSYVQDGHGGNVGLKSRDPSDYQVSILEVSGSTATVEDILAAEQLWKAKLQSREMGLNRN